MSQETVIEVIRKALVDEKFRSQLFSDPGAALSGYDLTEEERASLSALEEEAFDAFASEIEERVSKAGPGLNLPLRPSMPVPFMMSPRDINRLLGG
jgi:hypothetical protein